MMEKLPKMPELVQTIADKLKNSGTTRSGASMGPIVGHCPDVSDNEDAFCWKFNNADPNARYDFWMIKSGMRSKSSGQTMQTTLQLAGGNGELYVISTSVEYESLFRSEYIKVMKSEYGNFGVVQISKMKVREIYNAFCRAFYSITHDVYRFSAEGELLSYEARSGKDWPPLEPEELKASKSVQAKPMDPHTRFMTVESHELKGKDILFFPDVMPVFSRKTLKDFVVDNGDLLPEKDHPVFDQKGEFATPGVYLELCQDSGPPEMSMTVLYRVDMEGQYHLMFSKMCTGFAYQEFHERIIIKKKSSWRGKKVKIIHIINELKRTGIDCMQEQYPLT